MSNRMPVLTAALSARAGILTQPAVDQLHRLALTNLPEQDELRLAVLTFCAAHARDKRDPAALAVHGTTLEAELDEILKLTPAEARTRVDLDG